MRKEMLLMIAAFFLVSLTAITGVYANEEGKVITITKEEQDITGDGINDEVSLIGVPFKDEYGFFKKIYIEVAASNNKIYRFPLEGGSQASLKLVDLNNDGIKDLYSTVETGDNDGETVNYLYSLKNFSKTNLSVPNPIETDGQFRNGYKAQISIKPTGKKYVFDLKDRETYYKKLGLFYRGKLNEPTELTVNSYSTLKPVRFDAAHTGLVGIQAITGASNADKIAYIKSSWLYVQGKWSLKNVVVENEGEKTQ